MKLHIAPKGKLIAALALGACLLSPLTVSAEEMNKTRPDRHRESRSEVRPDRPEQAKRERSERPEQARREARPERPEQARREARPERPEQARREAKPKRPEQARRQAAPDPAKIRRMMREMMALKRAGKHDEAARLANRNRAAIRENPRVAALIEQAMSGRQGPPHDGPPVAASRPMHSPAAGPGGMRGHPGDKAALPRVKVHHLRLAARHLHAAGYKEQAEIAHKEIKKIIAEARRSHAKPSTAGPEMREEMKKLRKELNELRAQVRKLQK